MGKEPEIDRDVEVGDVESFHDVFERRFVWDGGLGADSARNTVST